MIQYIKDLADNLVAAANAELSPGVLNTERLKGRKIQDVAILIKGIAREIDRLEAIDFAPDVRYDFVISRETFRSMASNLSGFSVTHHTRELALDVSKLLDSYGGTGSGVITRDFSFIANTDMRKIVDRDYKELTQRVFPDKSWKSTILLSGSILEAVLYDQLTSSPERIKSAMGAKAAPKYLDKTKGKKVPRDITKNDRDNQWMLNDLIQVACELEILQKEHKGDSLVIIKNFRNFIHPTAELRMNSPISDGHATASKGMLDIVLDQLSK